MNSGDQYPFLAFLRAGLDKGGFETDDVLATILPLMRQTLAAHEEGMVVPLEGLAHLQVDEHHLSVDMTQLLRPRHDSSTIRMVERPVSGAIQVVAQARRSAEIDRSSLSITNLEVGIPGEPVTKPVFLPGYISWEHVVAHHDELTDIFSLGMLLASLSCGLDFTDAADLELFANHRENLFAVNPRLNPVISSVIVEMTALNRHRRAQDLRSLIRRLENYRDQSTDIDLDRIAGGKGVGTKDRRKLIQAHLRDRLFDMTRRNRLLYFKPTLQTLNLTIASVPLVLNFRNIRAEQLFTWHTTLASDIASGAPITLGKYLRFEDAPYIQPVLDKIISEARRDRSEFGFAQLKLVLVFLRWHNVKEDAQERIHSPLLLLPVELTKKRGVRDHYVLEPTTSEAEVNPALRHSLKQLFNLELPEIVDLRATSMDEFHSHVQSLIHASEPAVTLLKVDKPQIELIHERARQRVDQYRRRVRPRKSEKSDFVPLDYSYNQENLHPLGLQLFLERIKPSPMPLRDVVGAPAKPRLPNIMEPAGDDGEGAGKFVEIERQTFALRKGEQQNAGNPYAWEFDLCAITLGNFNYRKMTLVRDYNNLIESNVTSEAFERIFSLDPKPAADGAIESLPLNEQHTVISCDTTQSSAIARSRTGQSYIIQGPPGTGKSQTITNLIADYVGRGKRVLFVCQKRAAIDVVFHRLRQRGLDELCCLIHDSQADKKAFVQNLKQTSEQWLAHPERDKDAEKDRAAMQRSMEREWSALAGFSRSMCEVPAKAGIPLHELLRRLVDLRAHLVQLPAEQEEQMPDYVRWLEHGELARRLAAVLDELGEEPWLATHPFRWLNKAVVQSDRPVEALGERIERAEALIDELEEAFSQSGLPEENWQSMREIETLLEFLLRVRPLAERDLLKLLDPQSRESILLSQRASDFEKKVHACAKASSKTTHWSDKLPLDEALTALSLARKCQGSILAIFNPGWWRLRGVIKRRYDLNQHAVKPGWTRILEDLIAEYEALELVESSRGEARRDYGTDDLLRLAAEITQLQTEAAASRSVQSISKILLTSPQAVKLLRQLVAAHPLFTELLNQMSELLVDYRQFGFAALGEIIRDLREASDTLPELLPALIELADCPEDFSSALRRFPLRVEQFEAAMANKTLCGVYRQDRGLNRFDGRTLARTLERLQRQHRAWLDHNAAAIRARVRRQFTENLNIASMPAAQLSPEQKAFKKRYAAGRRELEHEFGKTMRYKSIRELTGSDSGTVVRDLKPIWLMSPLSISDTLPLDPGLFDVVIFDEASQIPMEEAVPAIYRAHQAIVVGDEMQLPPTSFFTAGRPEDDELAVEEHGERIEVALDANSFLNQSARNLPSTLLAWHYRSRYEALIGFSNAAFYGGKLFTIPDRQLPQSGLSELLVKENSPGDAGADALLARSVSFHSIEHGVYENRRNPAEANYIAQLVRSLLQRESTLSLGIVAFSEAQQTEIEEALDRLSGEDADFSARLEAELEREEDDQFCGLFVRNLENVQGDERDVIILSICYGYDANKRMLMNFGPVNQRGGEKRLNVIFSRAKQHMAVVSSIRHSDIKNDYNDGANALKNFLRYAEALSKGDAGTGRRVLDSMNPLMRKSLTTENPRDAVLEELKTRLEARGYQVDARVGQSRFQCDLAVRDADNGYYQLGILLDTAQYYGNPNLVERYLLQPSVLQDFGWRVALVLTKDWFHEPEAVLDRLERVMRNSASPAEIDEEPTPAVVDAPNEASSFDNQARFEQPTPEPSSIPALPSQMGREASVPQGPVRRFEFVGGASRKFWEISLGGNQMSICFGRIGSKGQQHTKSFADEARARHEREKLIAEKLKKGYREAPPLKEQQGE